ncbi:MAG: CapA family protein [Oscillospiraceae bacterium]|nr:CapA family protein [Oscillospiraceae bacterium]
MKNDRNIALDVAGRLVAVAATVSLCLLMSTASRLPHLISAEAEAPVFSESPAAPPAVSQEAPPEPAARLFELSFVGDCTLASTSYNKKLAVSYESVVRDNYAYPFEKTVRYLSGDDFTFANLECALTTSTVSDDKNFTFRADPAYVQIMKEGSVEFVTLGNNHVLDYGEQGYLDTRAALDGVGIAYAGRDEWCLYETDSGLKIGVYAVSFGQTEQIKKGVAAVRAAGAEFVIAALHWGDEGSYKMNGLQAEQGRAAVDAGADLVIGSHPHTLQPYEEYNGRYIYYSMGNWSFGGNTSPRDPDTIILKVIVKKAADGTISIARRRHIPCTATGAARGNSYQPAPYEPGSAEYERTISKIEGRFDGPDLTIDYVYDFNEY